MIDGANLLSDLANFFYKYVRVGGDEYTVLAAWVLHCHAFAAFSRTPYLHVSSPAPECGKTLLLELLEQLVPEPMLASSCTAAVLSRCIDESKPVLMVDEFDQLMAGDKELLAAILATVNSGYKESGKRIILEPKPSNGKEPGGWQPRKLSTFCPKVMAGISGVPSATASRCILIRMERLAPGDTVAEPDHYVVEPEAEELKARCECWADAQLETLMYARPNSPAGLHNRKREVSRPLFAIADAVGGEWPERVRQAVVRLFATRDTAPADDIKIELIADIREVFGDKPNVASVDLVQGLATMDDRPWATWGKGGSGINPNQLARLLKDFKLYPSTLRLADGRRLKGYERAWFQPIWERYLPHPDLQAVTPCQPTKRLDEMQISNRDTNLDVTDAKCEKPAPLADCHAVTRQRQERGTATDHDFDVGAMALAEARIKTGLPVAPAILAEYRRWVQWLDSRSEPDVPLVM